METFQFVNLSHPEEIKEKQIQRTVRGHAIRTSFKKSTSEAVQRKENFVTVEMDDKKRRASKKRNSVTLKIPRDPALNLMDPFETLPASPERLRFLMRQKSAKQAGEPIFCIEGVGEICFEGMDSVFRSSLADPALFHALSLALSLADNMNILNVECLAHRGALLRHLAGKMSDPVKALQASTLSALLLLIGCEYRIGEFAGGNIAKHIEALREIMRLYRISNLKLCDGLQRALFWQDLYSCLIAGTSRVCTQNDCPDLILKIEKRISAFESTTLKTNEAFKVFPGEFVAIIHDLSMFCAEVDHSYRSGNTPITMIEIDDCQAWFESRLVDVLHEWKTSGINSPVQEACVLAAFICTYKLSTAIWEGCFVPRYVAERLLEVVERSSEALVWTRSPELLLWLLFVGGSLTERKRTRLKSRMLIVQVFEGLEGFYRDWESLKRTLEQFIWCEHVMERKFFGFWTEVHREQEVKKRLSKEGGY